MTRINYSNNQLSILGNKSKASVIGASAGSGKTTVMIQKIINYVIDNRMDVRKILVLTFTEASANDMKKKLYDAIADEIQSGEGDIEFLKRQFDAIDQANISTIDAFCYNIVSKYGFVIGVNPKIKIADDEQLTIVKQTAFDNTIKFFDAMDDNDIALFKLQFTRNRNLATLRDIVYGFASFLRVLDNEAGYIESAFNNYKLPVTVNNAWKGLWSYINEQCDAFLAQINEIRRIAIASGIVEISLLMESLLSYCEQFTKCDESSLKTLFSIEEIKPVRVKNAGLQSDEKEFRTELQKSANSLKNDFKKKIIEKAKSFFCIENIEVIEKSLIASKRTLETFVKFAKQWQNEFDKLKAIENVRDFADIEKMCFELMQNETILSQAIAKFDYVFVDEYQDINALQDSIINLIIRDDNFFLVGDVKQAIYSFRLSNPFLLIARLQEARKSDFAEVFDLNENYRSDKRILDFVNQVCLPIMTQKCSGIDYAGGNMLVGKSEFENENSIAPVNVVVVPKNKKSNETVDTIYDIKSDNESSVISNEDKECDAIVDIIMKCIGSTIEDKRLGGIRKVNYGDIAILVGSRTKVFETICERLENAGVPINASKKSDIFAEDEIVYLIDWLKFIAFDDEFAYINVLSKWDSEVTSNDYAKIRSKFLHCSMKEASRLYAVEYTDSLAERIRDCNEFVTNLRSNLCFKSVYEILLDIIGRCDYINFCLSQRNGVVKADNVDRLLSFVSQSIYNENILDFVAFVDGRSEQTSELGTGNGGNSITITTIHKSKGLEWPIVIFADTDKGMNWTQFRSPLIYTINGLATNDFNIQSFTRIPTIALAYLSLEKKLQSIEEEKRKLYVALTRAKNHLFIVGVANTDELHKLKNYDDFNPNMLGYIIGGIEPTLWESFCTCGHLCTEKIEIKIASEREYKKSIPQSIIFGSANERLVKGVKDVMEYRYPHRTATTIAIKNSVSRIVDSESDSVVNYNNSPKLFTLNESEMSRAEIGTLYHKILEKVDVARFADDESIIDNLVEKGVEREQISNVELSIIIRALNDMIDKFGDAEYIKEQSFLMKVPYNEIVNSDVTDKVLVQGVVDLIVKTDEEYFIVDYKMTSIKNEDILREKYSKQLELYRKATESALGVKVKDVYIYSILDNKFVLCR